MPLYEYECESCGRRFERIQKFSDSPATECPTCGGPVKKLFSSPAIQFKGSGFYITDYAKPGSAAGAEGGDPAAKPAGDAGGKAGEPAKADAPKTADTPQKSDGTTKSEPAKPAPSSKPPESS